MPQSAYCAGSVCFVQIAQENAFSKVLALSLKLFRLLGMEPEFLRKSADPLCGHRLLHSTDVELARAAVAEQFCDHDLIPGPAHGTFDACHNQAQGQNLSLNYMRYGCDVTINPGELTDFYLVQIPLCGAAKVRNGRKTVEATHRTGSVLNPTRDTHMVWYGGCEKLLLQIDAAALHQTAERILGQSLLHPIVFDPALRLESPELQNWERKFRAAVAVADQKGAFGDSQHKHQALFEEELIAGLLMAQPSTVHHILTQAQPHVSSPQINRARAYILENLTDPITVAQIAAAAGCSIRSLQLSFQQSFGCTPIGFLAHMLAQSLPKDTLVSGIAYEAGFFHLGRFSIAYREVFGCSPRETLAQNRFS
jgi:AraC-like DNA-binding protein